MPQPTIERIYTGSGYVWRVCVAGMCKQHQQDWQALVFYHQMLNSYPQSTGAPVSPVLRTRNFVA
jgi:hypothetical protein